MTDIDSVQINDLKSMVGTFSNFVRSKFKLDKVENKLIAKYNIKCEGCLWALDDLTCVLERWQEKTNKDKKLALIIWNQLQLRSEQFNRAESDRRCDDEQKKFKVLEEHWKQLWCNQEKVHAQEQERLRSDLEKVHAREQERLRSDLEKVHAREQERLRSDLEKVHAREQERLRSDLEKVHAQEQERLRSEQRKVAALEEDVMMLEYELEKAGKHWERIKARLMQVLRVQLPDWQMPVQTPQALVAVQFNVLRAGTFGPSAPPVNLEGGDPDVSEADRELCLFLLNFVREALLPITIPKFATDNDIKTWAKELKHPRVEGVETWVKLRGIAAVHQLHPYDGLRIMGLLVSGTDANCLKAAVEHALGQDKTNLKNAWKALEDWIRGATNEARNWSKIDECVQKNGEEVIDYAIRFKNIFVVHSGIPEIDSLTIYDSKCGILKYEFIRNLLPAIRRAVYARLPLWG
ncbi:uncharacterized protein LOC121688855 isoform X1 [Alosa sapidissima]|uniref:uncharacterized protein LOC121688855 isoform X1 n=1 Tax=Alosa sapidissima TaxID=34773 RepID=UPI001C08F929|nr:uncharacterized protein LOC121688855 isoform X1 [Alosa sapidissima]